MRLVRFDPMSDYDIDIDVDDFDAQSADELAEMAPSEDALEAFIDDGGPEAMVLDHDASEVIGAVREFAAKVEEDVDPFEILADSVDFLSTKVSIEDTLTSFENNYTITQQDELQTLAAVNEFVETEDDEGEWFRVIAKYVDDWENSHPDISQTGLIADDTGSLKVTTFAEEKAILQEGKVYEFDALVTDTYKNDDDDDDELEFSLKVTRNTEIEHLPDEEIETTDEEFTGRIVNVQTGSGLIKRCTEGDCTRVLNNGECSAHGSVSGEHDMRIKATVDDGVETKNVVFGADRVEELTGMDLDEAKQLAKDALDTTVVVDELKPQVLGEQVTVRGYVHERDTNPTLNVASFEVSDGLSDADLEDALIKARS